jgi:hypothetical protein
MMNSVLGGGYPMFSSITSESLSKKDGNDDNTGSGGESMKKRYAVGGANDYDIALLRTYSSRSIDRVNIFSNPSSTSINN